VALLVGLLLAAPSGPARGDGARDQARGEFDKAQIQYKIGHFQEALEGYARAYQLFPAPAFLFNIGQCHKNLKNYERAIFFFEGYLREENKPDKRALAEELLAESRAALDKQMARASIEPAAGAGAGARPPVAGAAAGMSGAAPRAPAILAPAAVAPAPVLLTGAQQNPGAIPARPARSWWPWAVAGGVVAAAVGGYLYWSSGSSTMVPPTTSLGTVDRRGP
jgi:hypothetical protein